MLAVPAVLAMTVELWVTPLKLLSSTQLLAVSVAIVQANGIRTTRPTPRQAADFALHVVEIAAAMNGGIADQEQVLRCIFGCQT
jgi:hypothetical protein